MERAAAVRSALRHATREAHRRLDAVAATLDLTQRGDYVAFLAASAAALIPLEALLDKAGMARVVPDWPLRRRSQALLADLSALGGAFDLTTVTLGGDALSDAELLGAAYVLEGSRLGAPVLLRQVQRAGDPVMAGQTRYLQHGAGASFWQSFLGLMEASPHPPGDMHATVRGSLLAFSVFEEAFRAIPPAARK